MIPHAVTLRKRWLCLRLDVEKVATFLTNITEGRAIGSEENVIPHAVML
jgi:hypothetical protein